MCILKNENCFTFICYLCCVKISGNQKQKKESIVLENKIVLSPNIIFDFGKDRFRN